MRKSTLEVAECFCRPVVPKCELSTLCVDTHEVPALQLTAQFAYLRTNLVSQVCNCAVQIALAVTVRD
jgi:hypothetical protein